MSIEASGRRRWQYETVRLGDGRHISINICTGQHRTCAVSDPLLETMRSTLNAR